MIAIDADLLATIVAATRRIVEVRRSREPFDLVMRRAEAVMMRRAARGVGAPARSPLRGNRGPTNQTMTAQPHGAGRFRAALQHPDRINVIAECKRRSPSRGVLRANYDPVALASSYERSGAAAISVLTEPTFFDGSLEHLRAVADRVNVPILRKDFIIDEYQIVEARAAGADAILLIVSALSADALRRLHLVARRLGLDALVEVHDAAELDRALAAGAEIVGVNNRNLRTLTVDTQVSAALIERIPRTVTAVAESGFKSAEELGSLREAGYRAFLVGERLVTSADPEEALRELLAPG
jgi:indole-3-glycerol phosphate synthase